MLSGTIRPYHSKIYQFFKTEETEDDVNDRNYSLPEIDSFIKFTEEKANEYLEWIYGPYYVYLKNLFETKDITGIDDHRILFRVYKFFLSFNGLNDENLTTLSKHGLKKQNIPINYVKGQDYKFVNDMFSLLALNGDINKIVDNFNKSNELEFVAFSRYIKENSDEVYGVYSRQIMPHSQKFIGIVDTDYPKAVIDSSRSTVIAYINPL